MNKFENNSSAGNKDNRQNRDNKREKFIRHNWQIKNQSCRIIEDGQPPKSMRTKDAIDLAQSMGLDLIEVGYDRNAGQSICKIMEYGKYVYEMKQREKQAKKQARANRVDTKEIQLSLTIDVADEQRMVNRAREFLEEGDKVKVALRFRGKRELNNVDLAKSIVKRVIQNFEEIAVLDVPPQLSGKELFCVIRPVKNH